MWAGAARTRERAAAPRGARASLRWGRVMGSRVEVEAGMGEEGGDEQLILNNIQAIQVTHVRFSLSA